MKKIVFTFFAILLFASFTTAQNYKDNWYFPHNLGLDFNGGTTPTAVTGSMITGYNHSTTMSDDNGNLLFYSNANFLWNSNNVTIVVANGNLEGSDNSAQGVSFKNPNNQSQYYYFYINQVVSPEGKLNSDLFYSIIETNNAPNLTVPIEDIPVNCLGCTGNEFAEAITAVPHCNGIDYWMIVHGDLELIVYLVNPSGVSQHGIYQSSSNPTRGILKSSPDGNKLALATISGFNLDGSLNIYDFNATTGVISNEIQIST